MEYSKEDLMEAKKQIWGVGENMEQRKVKKSGRRTHNFGIMQWVTNLMNFTDGTCGSGELYPRWINIIAELSIRKNYKASYEISNEKERS